MAQNLFENKPIVKNYGTSHIASPSSFSGKVLDDNTLLFANGGGLLQFDGSNWKLIKTIENSDVLSLYRTDSVIYVAGVQEFGYLKLNSSKEYEYSSFTNSLPSDIIIDQFFQIVAYKNELYFQTDYYVFRWDGKKIHPIPIEYSYIFNVNEVLYASTYEGLAEIRNDSIIYLNQSSKMHQSGAYNIFESSDPNVHTIFTAYDGAYNFNLTDNSITKIDNEVSTLFKKEGFYYGTPFLDSLWIAATSDGSIVVFNEQGNILKRLDKSVGITGLYLRELFIDKRNKIWVTSDVGISEIYWPEFDTLTTVACKINTIEINGISHKAEMYPDSALYDNVDVKFGFSALGFNQDEVQYSIKMEGLDNEWSNWSSNNTKEYTKLDGGSYNFQVKCKTFNGLESNSVNIPIIIKTLWYKSIWAYLLYGFLAFGLITLILWFRTLRLRISNRRLESLVSIRTDEITTKSKELVLANKNLSLKNQELDHFVYRSSHDLIAPLKSLKGLIYLAKSDNSPDTQSEYLKHMETSVLKLEDFIHSIIEFATNAKTEANTVEIKLDEILDDVTQELKYFDRAKDVNLVRTLEESIVVSDYKRLKIIFSNLISNSVKYHNYNQSNPFIEIKSYKKGDKVFIEIKDNGQGIKPDLLEHIFKMFYRASDSSEGSGLGLYIVKDTVDKINGELTVDSDYGKGTVFTLTINS